jgi:hypothetical protein
VGGGNDLNLWASLTDVRVVDRPTRPPSVPEPVDMATCIAPLVPLAEPVYAVGVPSGSVQLTHRFGTRQLSAYVAIQRLFAASPDDPGVVDLCTLEAGETALVAKRLEVTEGAVTLAYERSVLSAYVQDICTEMVIRVYRLLPGETAPCSGELVLETGPPSYQAATIAPAFE